jgi:hypothetical protein
MDGRCGREKRKDDDLGRVCITLNKIFIKRTENNTNRYLKIH